MTLTFLYWSLEGASSSCSLLNRDGMAYVWHTSDSFSATDDDAALASTIVVIAPGTSCTRLNNINISISICICNDNARRGSSKDCGARFQQIGRMEISPTRRPRLISSNKSLSNTIQYQDEWTESSCQDRGISATDFVTAVLAQMSLRFSQATLGSYLNGLLSCLEYCSKHDGMPPSPKSYTTVGKQKVCSDIMARHAS